MQYFWAQQDDIPEGLGYPLFGTAHLISVSVTFIIVGILLMIFMKYEDKRQKRILFGIPLLMIALEIWKELLLRSIGRFGIGYLPLHICSIGVMVFFLREILPFKKAKMILAEIAYVVIMPCSVAALLFADWTVHYPVLNFINLHSYVWHGLLIVYPLLVSIRGEVAPTVKHIHYLVGFFIVVVPPIYAFDKHFGCNYLYLNWPAPNSPLSWIVDHVGRTWYLPTFGLLVLVLIILIYSVIWLFKKL